jgi:hypothetical protein
VVGEGGIDGAAIGETEGAIVLTAGEGAAVFTEGVVAAGVVRG